MSALTARPRPITPLTIAGVVALALVTLGASMKVGPLGLAVPLIVALLVVLIDHPSWALGVFVGSLLLAERTSGNLLPGVTNLYYEAPGGATPADGLLVLAVAAVALDLYRRRTAPVLTRPMQIAGGSLVIAMAMGMLVGHFRGSGWHGALLEGRSLPYLALVPLLTANLVHTTRDARRLVWLLGAAAIAKSILGLLAVAAGKGVSLDGTTITYYEPAANFLAMAFVAAVLAALLAKVRVPLWAILGSPIVIAALALSLRRSFWIGTVLTVLLVIVLGLSAGQRRMLIPVGLLLFAALYVIFNTGFQASGPLVERAQSLKPSKVQANAEDRYRLDERANVVAEIRRAPLTGLGLNIPWRATTRGLPTNHPNGRAYVHTTLLWFWLKLGILGAIAYAATLWGWGLLAWRAWRHSPYPAVSVFGLAALATLAGMVVVESTASFTGVEGRFTALLGVVLGLLAALPGMRAVDA